MNISEPEHTRRLMMASIDGETTPAEEEELKRILLNDLAAAEEYHELKNLNEMTSQTRLKEPPPELWDSYRYMLYSRLERKTGWILFTTGAFILLAYAAWNFLSETLYEPGLAWWIKAAIFSFSAGVIVLFISIIREQIYLYKHERYKDIIR